MLTDDGWTSLLSVSYSRAKSNEGPAADVFFQVSYRGQEGLLKIGANLSHDGVLCISDPRERLNFMDAFKQSRALEGL